MALRDGAWCQDRRYVTKDQASPASARLVGNAALRCGIRPHRPIMGSPVWARSTRSVPSGGGEDRRHGPAESVRNQTRQAGMGAQWLADQVGAAGVQSFLEQAVGQQIGGDHDARAPSRRAGPCPFDGLLHLRISGGRESQAHPRSDQRGQRRRGDVQVGARPVIRCSGCRRESPNRQGANRISPTDRRRSARSPRSGPERA